MSGQAMDRSSPERSAVAPAPRLGGAIRAAMADFVGHSWRLVVVNLTWGAGLLILLAAASLTPLAWLLAPLLALPTVGLYRVVALIAREEPVAVFDGFTAWRRFGGRALLVGSALLAVAAVLTTNLVTGLEARGLAGWSLATFAGWGLAALAILAVVLWPLLVDPRRDGSSLRHVLRLGALMALAHPLRLGLLAAVLLIFLAVSTVALVAVLSVSVAFAALVSCRYVLPAADRFAARHGVGALSPGPAAPAPPAHREIRGPR